MHCFVRPAIWHRAVGLVSTGFVMALFAIGAPTAATAQAGAQAEADLQLAIADPLRAPSNSGRDPFRNPAPVLTFFKIAPTSRVIEILPGTAGYWTEILAPYLQQRGQYIAALPKPNPERVELMKAIADTKAKLAADPKRFSRVETVDFSTDGADLGVPGSADFVLTFRNLHNWMAAGKAELVLASFHKVLRSGGVVGIEEHRGRTDQPQDPLAKSGYVREDYTIAMMEKAGFKLVAKSEVNSNPKDTKDHASGVWTLPPTYRLKDVDRAKYEAIGESDRFVMTFVKP
jgi:predicted methyltransferase